MKIQENVLGMADDAIRDSWVVGYTTKTVIAMWYGYEETTAESVAQGYYCHNLSGTIQRDRLFTAIANEVFEDNKEEFTMPESVVRVPLISGSSTAKLLEQDTQVAYFMNSLKKTMNLKVMLKQVI